LVGDDYKIFSKVLTNRLKTVLGKVISKTQNAFFRGRQKLDSILIPLIVESDQGNQVCFVNGI